MNRETLLRPQAEPATLDAWALFNALILPVLVLRQDRHAIYANLAAEQFLGASLSYIQRRGLNRLLPDDSPIFALVDQVFRSGSVVSDYGVTLETPRLGRHIVTLQATPIADQPDLVIMTIHEESIARKIDSQLTHRSAARSVTAMAAVLAHEIKNPLSGIRGAAQLLEPSLGSEDRGLTTLICEETDRICALVDRMEVFADGRPIEREPVNIHQVLEHVRKVSDSGFARGIRFREDYDPSLPPVYGNRHQLIQVFLNLVKNAAEAVGREDGEILLSTSYRQGVRLALPASNSRVDLPLVVSVQDNGPGIPEEMKANLFDPFVTTKSGGTGLGLALVAKIVNDHGGAIEVTSEHRRTCFNVMLPMHRPEKQGKA